MAEPPALKGAIRRRGRPRVRRELTGSGPFCFYALQCDIHSATGTVILLPDEIDILRLIDLDGLEQEEAARVLGISRRTLWKDLHETRKKVTDALVHGKIIEISGCTRRIQGGCPKREMAVSSEEREDGCPRRCTIQIEVQGREEEAAISTPSDLYHELNKRRDTAQ